MNPDYADQALAQVREQADQALTAIENLHKSARAAIQAPNSEGPVPPRPREAAEQPRR